ncbi:senescence associated gene 20-like [Typha latifolia]|uniref:senescence associated gene 20-like n=1 Tax=Typha latifolia TaxID=4733 RepID=UPI003C2FBBC6
MARGGELKVELANQEPEPPRATASEEEERNKQLVRDLYEALNDRRVEVVHRLLQPDVDWWFHGPRTGQHLMRHLTGQSGAAFEFVLENVEAFGSTVLVEGTGAAGDGYWVHAWTVGPDGVINRVREYFNTTLTVTKVGDGSASNKEASPASVTHCLPVWQSKPLLDKPRKSLPGLILAI